MKIVVNDANILIDLVELKLLPQFFALKFEFFTTSLILEELLEDQQIELETYIKQRILIVEEMSAIDLVAIKTIEKSKPKLSQQDCSAYHQATTKQSILITSDNVLRKYAIATNIHVHGHLWVFDQMVVQKTLTPLTASQKLTSLCETINTQLKLPKTECDKRHDLWNK
ncbi:PIN domain-containing protein [Formosa maritima]|uniref:PIN domain-containing protein n=1 Tax=Formosa maritima TaxID=2592046 RepID=A0A5D0G9V8_9FLAO|nr:hypothetical protein [Formosa maritima]TYA55695.1 hypothetical protein FVF61_07205 [Formosa maritima]